MPCTFSLLYTVQLDFLFVFGTIIVDTEDSNQGDGLQEYQNFSLIVEGGAEGARFLIPKRYVSIIDFLSGNRRSSIVGDAFLEYDGTGADPLYSNNIFLALKSKLEGEPYNLATVENNWFELYGIYFS